MAMELGFDVVKELFLQTSIFGLGWITPLIISGLSVWLITRSIDKWKILAFPVFSGWMISGLRSYSLFDAVILTGLAIMFVVEAMSIETLDRMMKTVRRQATDIITKTTHAEREIAKEMGSLVKRESIKDRFKEMAHTRRLSSLERDIKLSLGKRGTKMNVEAQRVLDAKELRDAMVKAKKEKATETFTEVTRQHRLNQMKRALRSEQANQSGLAAVRRRFGEDMAGMVGNWMALRSRTTGLSEDDRTELEQLEGIIPDAAKAEFTKVKRKMIRFAK